MQSRHSTFSPCSSASQTRVGAPLSAALLMVSGLEMNSTWSAGKVPYTPANPGPVGVTSRGAAAGLALRASCTERVAAARRRPPAASLRVLLACMMCVLETFSANRGGGGDSVAIREGNEAGVLSRPVLAAEIHRVDGDHLPLGRRERVLVAL